MNWRHISWKMFWSFNDARLELQFRSQVYHFVTLHTLWDLKQYSDLVLSNSSIHISLYPHICQRFWFTDIFSEILKEHVFVNVLYINMALSECQWFHMIGNNSSVFFSASYIEDSPSFEVVIFFVTDVERKAISTDMCDSILSFTIS
jgi:hypothetical protein